MNYIKSYFKRFLKIFLNVFCTIITILLIAFSGVRFISCIATPSPNIFLIGINLFVLSAALSFLIHQFSINT